MGILENQWLNTLMIVTFWIMGLSHCVIVYIMTWWVRREIIKDDAHHLSMTRRFSSNGQRHLALDVILEHQLGYELFMEHLNLEMSGENLLSLTEFVQYKQRIREMFVGQIDAELVRDRSVSDSKLVGIPSNCPRSIFRNRASCTMRHSTKDRSPTDYTQSTSALELSWRSIYRLKRGWH